jgi:hypothetical protein
MFILIKTLVVLRRVMASRDPMKLRGLGAMHNLILSTFSLVTLVAILYYFIPIWSTRGTFAIGCDPNRGILFCSPPCFTVSLNFIFLSFLSLCTFSLWQSLSFLFGPLTFFVIFTCFLHLLTSFPTLSSLFTLGRFLFGPLIAYLLSIAILRKGERKKGRKRRIVELGDVGVEVRGREGKEYNRESIQSDEMNVQQKKTFFFVHSTK